MDTEQISRPWHTWQILGIVIVALILIILYYYNKVSKLTNEIKQNVKNFQDPDLETTRDLIMAKLKSDVKKKLTSFVKTNYKSIMEAEGKLREYKENKAVDSVVKSLDAKIDSEVNSAF